MSHSTRHHDEQVRIVKDLREFDEVQAKANVPRGSPKIHGHSKYAEKVRQRRLAALQDRSEEIQPERKEQIVESLHRPIEPVVFSEFYDRLVHYTVRLARPFKINGFEVLDYAFVDRNSHGNYRLAFNPEESLSLSDFLKNFGTSKYFCHKIQEPFIIHSKRQNLYLGSDNAIFLGDRSDPRVESLKLVGRFG